MNSPSDRPDTVVGGRPVTAAAPILQARGLTKHYSAGRGSVVQAVDGIDLDVGLGRAVGLVGESGSGKSTLARCLLRLTDISGGSIVLDGEDITRMGGQALRRTRRKMQVVFQDPLGSFDPRRRVHQILDEPLRLLTEMPRAERTERVSSVLERVHLGQRHLERYPHQLSGGQLQRVAIARALVTYPKFIVLDEPTSALDWSVRADVLDLLAELREELGLSYLFISHDISAVRYLCDEIAVMYLGRIVEHASCGDLIAAPRHPYSRTLLSAVPAVGTRMVRQRLRGEPPSPIDPPSGCRLHPRCPVAVSACASVTQTLGEIEPGHTVACMRVESGETLEWPTAANDAAGIG